MRSLPRSVTGGGTATAVESLVWLSSTIRSWTQERTLVTGRGCLDEWHIEGNEMAWRADQETPARRRTNGSTADDVTNTSTHQHVIILTHEHACL